MGKTPGSINASSDYNVFGVKTAKEILIPFSWEERKPFFTENFFYIPPVYSPKDWEKSSRFIACPIGEEERRQEFLFFFPKGKKIFVEYCSGNGQWVADRAEKESEVFWIAVEKKWKRAKKIWKKLRKKQLKNLLVVCGDAFFFNRHFAPRIAKAFINFPDPWPKRSHAPRRVIQERFLSDLLVVMEDGGEVICVTDHEVYQAQMQKEFAKFRQWEFLFLANDWESYGSSYFQTLFTKTGKTLYYLSYRKNANDIIGKSAR